MRKNLALIAATALAWLPVGGAMLHAGPPPSGGTISIVPNAGAGVSDAAMHAFVDAASAALTARGFTVFDDIGHAASVVELLVSRGDVGMGFARATGEKPMMAGTGVAVPLGTGASQEVRLRRTRLEMRIHRRGETAIDWDGAAVTVREAGTAKGGDGVVAADLARALIGAYPTKPTEEIGVP